jgi:energy-coupling factor transporter ATP-binding protein EcfA2
MQASDNLVISTHGLSKTYQGVNALQNLDLHVARHSIFGFLGPNGAGKSTTNKLLLGLAKPSGGSATIFGQDSVRDSVAIRTRGRCCAHWSGWRREQHRCRQPGIPGRAGGRQHIRLSQSRGWLHPHTLISVTDTSPLGC